jgi:hypothetical protein
MPNEPKPKTFVAARGFSYGNRSYGVGDVVDNRRTVDRLVRYGDQFIVAKRSKSASAETTPAVDTATTPESTKED